MHPGPSIANSSSSSGTTISTDDILNPEITFPETPGPIPDLNSDLHQSPRENSEAVQRWYQSNSSNPVQVSDNNNTGLVNIPVRSYIPTYSSTFWSTPDQVLTEIIDLEIEQLTDQTAGILPSEISDLFLPVISQPLAPVQIPAEGSSQSAPSIDSEICIRQNLSP